MRILDRIDLAAVKDLLERDEFFWLDLARPSEKEISQLGELFGFHPLALEDTARRGQRPKLDDFGDYVFLVYYGARWSAEQGVEWVEVHLFISGGYIVTTHVEPCAELSIVRERLTKQDPRSELFAVYRIIDALTDSFFPVLDQLDERIDQIDLAVLEDPQEEHLGEIGLLRRNLIDLRRIVAPQRDLLAGNIDYILDLAGLETDSRNYFRDVYDHLIRIAELIDSYREVLSGSRDTYLSIVSNRLNQITKQLTIIATIFLPLTFITGFFGQNFKWLTDHISSTEAFLVFGPAVTVVTSIGIVMLFRRGGYL